MESQCPSFTAPAGCCIKRFLDPKFQVLLTGDMEEFLAVASWECVTAKDGTRRRPGVFAIHQYYSNGTACLAPETSPERRGICADLREGEKKSPFKNEDLIRRRGARSEGFVPGRGLFFLPNSL
mmetsp:Transcript_18322/g.50524  ORF Transcript_18322/g.50524 Transcript_18322/m.50524 type:complete len:124 (+) Transcript_18322:234-605(+)